MKDRSEILWMVFRLIVGLPLAAVGFGVIASSYELVGLGLTVIGLILAIPRSFVPVVSILLSVIIVGAFLWLSWLGNQFFASKDMSFLEWLKNDWDGLLVGAIGAGLWWFWQSTDPLKDREL
jgi:hypothetical protein